MNGISKLFKRISTWFDIFVKNSRDEYQLDKYIIPEYKQIKQAHQLLLKEYTRAIAAVSRLSFFVGFYEIKLPKEGFIRRILMLLLMKYSPFRLLILKPLVNLFVEIHINKKLLELTTAYTQTIFLIQNSLAENTEYLMWLRQAKQECDDFRQTLSSRRIFLDVLKSFGTFFLGLLLAFVGANSISDFLSKLFLNGLTQVGLKTVAFAMASLILIIPYVYLFWDSTFVAKRVIFLGIGSEISEKHNVYVFENEVFKLLGRGKSKEFTVDYFLQGVFQTGLVLFFWWLQIEFKNAVSGPHVIVLPYFSCISFLSMFSLLVDVIIPWQKRYSQKYI